MLASLKADDRHGLVRRGKTFSEPPHALQRVQADEGSEDFDDLNLEEPTPV